MAIATYRSEGDSIDYTPESAVSAGDVVDLGDFVGIAVRDIPADELGALRVEGHFEVAKKEGEEWALGEPVYWDTGTESFSNDSQYSEAAAGVIIADAATGDATGHIKLTPGIARS